MTHNPATGELDNQETDPAYFRSSPATTSLLPCPFCGGPVAKTSTSHACCDGCGVGISWVICSVPSHFARLYNTRDLAQRSPNHVSIPIDFIRNCGCPGASATMSVGDCADRGDCGCAVGLFLSSPAADSAGPSLEARDNDIGILLSALRYHEEAVGEAFDDEGGIIAQIEADHKARQPALIASSVSSTNCGGGK